MEQGKGERATPPAGPEIPSEEDIRKFCAQHRDLSIGMDSGIPEVWWLGWLATMLKRRDLNWVPRWRLILTLEFRADFVNPNGPGFLKAHGRVSEKIGATTAGTATGGMSPAQERFVIDRELAEVASRLDQAHELGQRGDPADVAREKELRNRRSELSGVAA